MIGRTMNDYTRTTAVRVRGERVICSRQPVLAGLRLQLRRLR